MQYRRLGERISEQVSALGFGCMRLPMAEHDGERSIDIPQAVEMFEIALDAGINYFDTAYPYHGGESEKVVGEHLCRTRRDEFLLATKMPIWKVEKESDFDEIFAEQLEKLQTDHIDFYLVHAIDLPRWTNAKELGIQSWMKKKQESGAIRYKGFSFHGLSTDFPKIIDDWADEWDFCQIQYNYIDIDHQAGRKGLRYAASRGIGVVIMEPLQGGSLATPPPSVVKALGDKRGADPVGSALCWLWDQAEVGVVLSGMSTPEQLQENLTHADRSGIGFLDNSGRTIYRNAKKAFDDLRSVKCTACEYCLPCPNGVAIPGVFRAMNQATAFNYPKAVRNQYGWIPEAHRASACIECGECMDKCPQKIDIITELKRANEYLTA
jgi:uncharacterized protein